MKPDKNKALFCVGNIVTPQSIQLAIALHLEGFEIYGDEAFFREMSQYSKTPVNPVEDYFQLAPFEVIVDNNPSSGDPDSTVKIHQSVFDVVISPKVVAMAICLWVKGKPPESVVGLVQSLREHHRLMVQFLEAQRKVGEPLALAAQAIGRFRLSPEIEDEAKENPEGIFGQWVVGLTYNASKICRPAS